MTQILGVVGGSKVWGLKQWAANLASDYIRDAIRPGMRYDELQIEQIIERARKNFHTVSRGAKTIGQLAHEWIEAHLRARLYATPELPLPVDEQTRKAIQAASAWIAGHFKPVSMEHRLYTSTLGRSMWWVRWMGSLQSWTEKHRKPFMTKCRCKPPLMRRLGRK